MRVHLELALECDALAEFTVDEIEEFLLQADALLIEPDSTPEVLTGMEQLTIAYDEGTLSAIRATCPSELLRAR